MKLQCLQTIAVQQFSILGRAVAKHPHWFILFPFLTSLVLSSGIFLLSVNRSPDELFTVVNGRAAFGTELVKSLFERNSTQFTTVVRQTTVTSLGVLQVLPKDDGNIFRKNVFNDIINLDRIITTFNTTWRGRVLSYSGICARMNDDCVRNNVLELASFISSDGLEKHAVKYPIDFNNLTFVLKEYVFSIGRVETDDEGYLTAGKGVRLVYIFDTIDSSKSSAIQYWLKGLNNRMCNLTFDNIRFNFYNPEEINNELKMMSDKALLNIPIVVSAVTLFAFFSCFTDNFIRSKPLVGLSSCISALLAIISGFGLCINLGLPFTDYHLIITFAVLAIEVDDAFILIAAWRETDPRDDVPKRMKQSYAKVGVSITITSATNFISFLIGLSTPFRIIRYLCSYAAATTFFSYVYSITFFGGCLALDGYREKQGKHPLMFLCSKGKLALPTSEDREFQEDFFMSKFRSVLGTMLTYSFVKTLIFACFITNMAIGIWGLNYLVCGNDYADVFSDNSGMAEMFNFTYEYFSYYSYPLHVIIDHPLNYADPKIQEAIDVLMEKFESHPHVADSPLRISWLKYYIMFTKSFAGRILLRGYNMSNKEDFIDGLHNVFLNFPRAKEFRNDIVFNENFTDIIATRFLIPSKHVTNLSVELQVKEFVYSVADQAPFPVHIFSPNFHILEQAYLIQQTTVTTAVVISGLILIMFFLFVPNISCSVCIFAIVACMFGETVGYMSLWGVKLDICSLITLILCIGFSINYPTHISFSYVNALNMSPNNRIQHALYEVGMPILQGSLSTISGILVLAFQNYYELRSIFKVIFIVTLQTAFHSLFVVLIFLGIIGRYDQSLSVQKEALDSEANTNMIKGKDLEKNED